MCSIGCEYARLAHEGKIIGQEPIAAIRKLSTNHVCRLYALASYTGTPDVRWRRDKACSDVHNLTNAEFPNCTFQKLAVNRVDSLGARRAEPQV